MSAEIAAEALVMQIFTESFLKHFNPPKLTAHPWNPRQNASPAAAMGPKQAIGSLVQKGWMKIGSRLDLVLDLDDYFWSGCSAFSD